MDKPLQNYIEKLFPICRSLTGNGNRQTLKILNEIAPIDIIEVPSGTKAFDWVVPEEWNCIEAYIITPDGEKICDFSYNNLYLVSYSIPVNRTIKLSELEKHLYSLPELPEAIPYVTSYYKRKWGFCIEHKKRKKLKDGRYKVYIDSKLEKGNLTYGELKIPSTRDTKEEIFLSTYVVEPPNPNNALLKMSNVVLSAHVGHFSDASMARRPRRFGEEIARVFSGQMPINLVNVEVNEKLQLK